MEEEWLSYGPGEAKALGEHLGSFNWEPSLYATARRMLAVAGRWPDGIRIKHKEGTPAALASEWLINFRHLMCDMERVAGGDTGAKAVSALFYTGQRLGRLEERFFGGSALTARPARVARRWRCPRGRLSPIAAAAALPTPPMPRNLRHSHTGAPPKSRGRARSRCQAGDWPPPCTRRGSKRVVRSSRNGKTNHRTRRVAEPSATT